MTLAYLGRMACLCLASFFLVHVVLGLMASAVTPTATRMAERLSPRAAARFMLALRLFPAGFGLLLGLGLFMPSYLWLEPKATPEPMGFVCVVAAFLGMAVWGLSAIRALRAAARSRRHIQMCQQMGRETHLAGDMLPVWVVETPAACVMLTGLLRPRLVISRNVLASLTAEQLSAALQHERAHGWSLDNFKRLLVLLAPDIVPFVPVFRATERAWARFTEWAADDRAAAGSPHRSLSLASALVQVARLSVAPAPVLATSLLADGQDLSARVDRLLNPAPVAKIPRGREPMLTASASLLLACAMVALLVQPSTMQSAHAFLEVLIR